MVAFALHQTDCSSQASWCSQVPTLGRAPTKATSSLEIKPIEPLAELVRARTRRSCLTTALAATVSGSQTSAWQSSKCFTSFSRTCVCDAMLKETVQQQRCQRTPSLPTPAHPCPPPHLCLPRLHRLHLHCLAAHSRPPPLAHLKQLSGGPLSSHAQSTEAMKEHCHAIPERHPLKHLLSANTIHNDPICKTNGWTRSTCCF